MDSLCQTVKVMSSDMPELVMASYGHVNFSNVDRMDPAPCHEAVIKSELTHVSLEPVKLSDQGATFQVQE